MKDSLSPLEPKKLRALITYARPRAAIRILKVDPLLASDVHIEVLVLKIALAPVFDQVHVHCPVVERAFDLLTVSSLSWRGSKKKPYIELHHEMLVSLTVCRLG